MQQPNKLQVIGIGYRPLGDRARSAVLSADAILASTRLAEVFQRYAEYGPVRERIRIIDKVPDIIDFIREWFSQNSSAVNELHTPDSALRTIVLLASGDPLFFGIGRRMVTEFGGERIEILPDLSSMQTAFAGINVAWDDAVFISLHGGPDIAKRRALPYEVKDIPRLLEKTGKLGILTDRENSPGVIARFLLSAVGTRQSEITMYVCERLGYPDEKLTQGNPQKIAEMTFADPNVVILQKSGIRDQESGIRFGLREDEILHERGLITKDEVRAVTLHKLRLPQQGVLWDVGAGSGSISLEASRLCPELRIFAVEKEPGRIEAVRGNLNRYGAGNVRVVQGIAPDALNDLPVPDRVFIGGGGGNLDSIIRRVSTGMPQGIVVVNAATLDTLHGALSSLENSKFTIAVSEISVSRSKMVAGKRLMNALNPVFIVTGEK